MSFDGEISSVQEDDEEDCLVESSALSAEDLLLFGALMRNDADAAAAQQAIRDGANLNAVSDDTTPLIEACERGFDDIVGILLDAGADTRWRDDHRGQSALFVACQFEHLSTVQLLINHDNALLEIVDNIGWTPLFWAVSQRNSDIFRFLLDSGANPHHADLFGNTAFMAACHYGHHDNARLLLDKGVDVEARDKTQRTALHHAASCGNSDLVRELILQHNANLFAVDKDGHTPFDAACYNSWWTGAATSTLLEVYGNKLTQDHDRLALHVLLKVAKYSFSEDHGFHPPLDPFRIILPLGKLTLTHLRTLLHTLDPALIHNRDDTGKAPLLRRSVLELDPAARHIADFTGALPIQLLYGTTTAPEDASVRYLEGQGGFRTRTARSHEGASETKMLEQVMRPLEQMSADNAKNTETLARLNETLAGAVKQLSADNAKNAESLASAVKQLSADNAKNTESLVRTIAQSQ